MLDSNQMFGKSSGETPDFYNYLSKTSLSLNFQWNYIKDWSDVWNIVKISVV